MSGGTVASHVSHRKQFKQMKTPRIHESHTRTTTVLTGETARLLAISIFLVAILSVSGCMGIGGSANPPSQQNQNAGSSPAIALSPSTISFGSVAVGGTANQSVTISNTGGSDLTVSQISAGATGLTVGRFSAPLTIHSGGQSTFDVIYSPKSTGSVSGVVSVMSNASSAPSTISVSGTAVPATSLLSASSTNLSFGNVAIGASAHLSVTLANTGNSSVTISSVTGSSGVFSTSGVSAGLILAPGQNATLSVVFAPSASGSLTGSLAIASSATNSPAAISLSGVGVQPKVHSVTLSWSPSISSVAGYNVYRTSSSGGTYTKLNSSLISSNQYTDPTAMGGQTYYYAATSVSSAGQEGSFSAPISVTIPTP